MEENAMFRYQVPHAIVLACCTFPFNTAAQAGQATILGIDPSAAKVNGISADGSTVVGRTSAMGAFVWRESTGLVTIGPGLPNWSEAHAASGDGSVVVGRHMGDNVRAFRWTQPTGLTTLSSNLQAIAFDVSADGQVVAGSSQFGGVTHFATRWVGGTPSNLGTLSAPAGSGSTAFAVSADGSVVVGQSVNANFLTEPFRWAGSMAGLGFAAANGSTSSALGISANGAVIVGRETSTPPPTLPATAWRWDGGFSDLGTLGGFVKFPFDASANGSVIVGRATMAGSGVNHAFIWDQAHGMRVLKSVLETEYGLDLSAWTLSSAEAISDDGLTIAGDGQGPGGVLGWIVRLPAPDTDGDGLLDDWETNGGVPYTDSFGAEQRYELDFDGVPGQDCHVDRKDIFVEVDCMVGMAPSPTAYLSVKAAFNAAPVTNPNGAASGIKLHIIEDELDIPAGDWTQDDTNGNGTADWPTEFDALKLTAVRNPPTLINGYFGTINERNFDNTVADATAVRGARAKVFRYCIFGRSMDAAAGTTGPGGIAEIGGNDFCVTMALWASVSPAEHAGTFMHELGHTLGLRHGGGDDINYKPNYYSVMNYTYQTPKEWMPPNTWPLEPGRSGFSAFALRTLNESALNECAAQVSPGSALAGTIFISSFVDGRNVHEWFGRYDVATDWNNSSGDCKDPIADDINRLPIVPGQPAPPGSPGQTLIGHDDWAAIDLNFRDSPCFAPGVHNSGLGEAGAIDITFEENQALVNMLPPFCAGDIIADRSVNIDDLLAVISAWGACPQGCVADIAPTPADGAVNIDDLLAVIAAWGACP